MQRWLLALLLSPVALLPAVAGMRASVAAEAAPATAAAPALMFDPRDVALDPNSAELRARAALEVGDLPAARSILDAALLLAAADPASRGRLLWLRAGIERDPLAAQSFWTALHEAKHPLARWATLRLGETLLTNDPSRAAALAQALETDFAGAGRARVLRALALHQAGDRKTAEPLLRALLEEAPKDSAASNFALPLVETLLARGGREPLREALGLCRRVTARSLPGETRTRAEELTRRVLSRMVASERKRLSVPSAEEELARGERLLDARRYQEAQTVLDKLASRLKRDPELRCKAELASGRALLFQKTQRKAAAKKLAAVARRCRDAEVRAWARYHGGTACQRSGDPAGAIALYEALVREQPSHSLADDVLFMLAVAHEDTGDLKAKQAALQRVLASYPQGDMRAETRFALALDARGRGDHAGALQELDRLIAEGPAEHTEAMEGRAAYWRARTLQALGRSEPAKTAYAELARDYPLSYHAQQALARLSELDPAAAASATTELSGPDDATSLLFARRSELDQPGFQTALELLRVGETELAKRELSVLGLLGERAGDDAQWLVAALFHEARAYPEASLLARSKLRGFRTASPRGRGRAYWRIAYPRAYEPLIEQAAAESRVPPEFVRAVAREESQFNPRVVSTALAYGLIQLIKPTARTHAKSLGLPADEDSLKRPDVNLRIGARYIQSLWQRYLPNPALVPAAYNAGEVAVDRWLRERGGQPLDEWIERIPYRETRRYSRRVLQSYGIYAFLDTGKLPALPATLPPAP
jgi:soluble lytic murein transglycosylase